MTGAGDAVDVVMVYPGRVTGAGDAVAGVMVYPGRVTGAVNAGVVVVLSRDATVDMGVECTTRSGLPGSTATFVGGIAWVGRGDETPGTRARVGERVYQIVLGRASQ